MRRFLLVLALIAASPDRALADDSRITSRSDRFLVAASVLVGGGGPSWIYGAFSGELGITIPRIPMHARARLFGVLAGSTADSSHFALSESDWRGDFSRVGAGVEGRLSSRRGHGCLFAGLDAGYQRLSLYDPAGELVRADNGPFVGPRFGFDAGGNVRFRMAVEVYRQFSDRTSSFTTLGIVFGLGYQR